MLIIGILILAGIFQFFAPGSVHPEPVVMAIAPAMWALMAAGAAKGAIDANQAKQRQKGLDKFRKQAIAMSPWTGMGDPGAMSAGNSNAMSGALGGGIQGAMIGAMGQGAGLWGGAAKGAQAAGTAAAAEAAAAGTAGAAGAAGQTGAAASAAGAPGAAAMPAAAPVASVPGAAGGMGAMGASGASAAPGMMNPGAAAGPGSLNPFSQTNFMQQMFKNTGIPYGGQQ